MNKEFVNYEQALALKKLGFDEPCFGLYHNDKTFYPTQCKSHEQFHGQICSAPLYQQAFRWFSEKCGLSHYNIRRDYYISEDGVRSYDDIELECLKKLIEIVKNK